MININKYNTLTDYIESDNIVSDECRVSQIGPSANMNMLYTPPNAITSNRVLTASQLQKDEVAIVVKDKLDGKIKYIPEAYFDPTTIDQSLYEVKNWIRYRGEGKLQLMVYYQNMGYVKVNSSDAREFALPQCYWFIPDLTQAGSWDVSVMIDGVQKSGTLSWSSGGSIADLVTSLSTILEATDIDYNLGTRVDLNGEDPTKINIALATYSNNGLTFNHTDGFSDNSTLEDLSTYLMYDDVDYSGNTRHGWQNQLLQDLLPAPVLADLRSAYGVGPEDDIYSQDNWCRHGENVGSTAGVNLARSVLYASTKGYNPGTTTMDLAFKNNTYAIRQEKFNSWTEGVSTFGTYENYMTAHMMDIDKDDGINALGRNRGVEITHVLAKIMTKDFGGNWVPAFPVAYSISLLTDPDLCPDGAGLPSVHEIGCFLCDVKPDRLTYVNSAISKLQGGSQLNTSGRSYCSTLEKGPNNIIRYNNTNGCMYSQRKQTYSKSILLRPTIVYSD